MVSTEEIKKLLSNVKYPEFEKDIVTFGFVKNIEIKNGIADINIEIVSANKETAKKVEEDVLLALKKGGVKAKVNVLQPKISEQKSNFQSNKNIAPHIKNFVMISSGKGGVGKSTTAVNLALALSLLGKKVGVLDADIYGPNIPRMLGAEHAKAEVVGEKLKPIVAHGLEMISMGVLIEEGQSLIWRGAMLMKALEQLLRDVLWSDLDVLFIDMPPGTGDAQLTIAQSIPVTCGVCVTTPQSVALDDASRSLDMFAKLHIPIAGIVENMSGFICPDNNKEYDIFGKNTTKPLAKKHNTEIIAQIPIEMNIREGGDIGSPIVISKQKSESAKRYKNGAALLWEKIEKINSNGGGNNSQIQPK